MSRILIIDNNDSFVYNLVQIVREQNCFGYDVVGINDLSLKSVKKYSRLLISPGPGLPNEYTNLIEVINTSTYTHSILGVCLGCQAIAMSNGMKLRNLEKPMHGHQSLISVIKDENTIFNNIPDKFKVGRYHSWVINPDNKPQYISVIAKDEDNNIMAIRHNELPVFGVQFHPESYISEYGNEIIINWLKQ